MLSFNKDDSIDFIIKHTSLTPYQKIVFQNIKEGLQGHRQTGKTTAGVLMLLQKVLTKGKIEIDINKDNLTVFDPDISNIQSKNNFIYQIEYVLKNFRIGKYFKYTKPKRNKILITLNIDLLSKEIPELLF